MPQYIQSKYSSGAIIILSRDHVSGVTVLRITSNQSIVIPEGRFFGINGHDKIYQIDADDDVRISANTPTNILIYPNLLENISSGAQLNFLNPLIKVLYHKNSPTSILHRATGRVEKIINVVEDFK